MGDQNKSEKKSAGKLKKSFQTQQFKSGAYSSVITVIVVAIVIVLNLVMTKLDLSTDLSSGNLYTLSSETKKVVKDTKDQITIYYMVTDGDEEEHIYRVLKQYNKLGDGIKMVKKDPVVYPGFAAKYVKDEVSTNDVIVVDETNGAAKYVSNADMFYTNQDYYSTESSEQYLDVEGRVTSAIQSVVSNDNTKMYMVTGHGETELGTSMVTALEKMNVSTESLELLKENKIPSDCSILLINGPTSDLMDAEKTAVLKYLKAGGNAILLTQYTDAKTPNYDEIFSYYGVTSKKGLVCESEGNYYQYANWIVPALNTDADITSGISSYAIMSNAEGFALADSTTLRSTVSLTSLMNTTDAAYLKVDPSSGTAKKQSGDLDGPFSVGVYAEETLDGDRATKLVMYSSADLLSDQYTSVSQLANASLLENAVKALSDSDTKEASIDAKSLSYSYVSLSSGAQILWAGILVVLLPLGLLIAGFSIWFVRRRK